MATTATIPCKDDPAFNRVDETPNTDDNLLKDLGLRILSRLAASSGPFVLANLVNRHLAPVGTANAATSATTATTAANTSTGPVAFFKRAATQLGLLQPQAAEALRSGGVTSIARTMMSAVTSDDSGGVSLQTVDGTAIATETSGNSLTSGNSIVDITVPALSARSLLSLSSVLNISSLRSLASDAHAHLTRMIGDIQQPDNTLAVGSKLLMVKQGMSAFTQLAADSPMFVSGILTAGALVYTYCVIALVQEVATLFADNAELQHALQRFSDEQLRPLQAAAAALELQFVAGGETQQLNAAQAWDLYTRAASAHDALDWVRHESLQKMRQAKHTEEQAMSTAAWGASALICGAFALLSLTPAAPIALLATSTLVTGVGGAGTIASLVVRKAARTVQERVANCLAQTRELRIRLNAMARAINESMQ
eukprot:TRINITY_DN10264_c0_g1_i1.p1 TRINITY_DN10264_c0_g1~~TRINITY_DN10264_c0_g1_i1.p1  ORF type:complete len:425 (-),score=128.09 TRINITY_DN10264_c0_g1_i1:113-1387(-)